MSSIDKTISEPTKILRARGRRLVSKVNEIDHERVKKFIYFLVPYNEARLALEVFAEPTLHSVLYFRQNLAMNFQGVKIHITTKEKDSMMTILMKDSPAFDALKQDFAELIKEKFVW